jgi:catechol 2,3-dioxygenase-like lactoylglutathione lyase family enzyme
LTIEAFVFVVQTARFGASVGFYRDVIGLHVVEEWTDFGHGAVLAAGDIARVELVETDAPAGDIPRHAPFLGLQVADVDAVHERARAAGAPIAADLGERPWGGRGFAVYDPNGVGINVYTAYER